MYDISKLKYYLFICLFYLFIHLFIYMTLPLLDLFDKGKHQLELQSNIRWDKSVLMNFYDQVILGTIIIGQFLNIKIPLRGVAQRTRNKMNE